MKIIPCATCRFRSKYDRNPGSVLGRLWRWHINWCPGWKSYMRSLTEEECSRLAETYGLRKGRKT
ncbi:hypothetical protein JXA40_01350 [bacterium]|nr:hypothetical protein [candidate division CSSED10-310 bacterium]